MQHLLFLLTFQFILISVHGQLSDHYQFEQEGRPFSLKEKMNTDGVPGFSTYLIYGQQQDSLAVGTLEAGGQLRLEHTSPFPVGAMSEAPVLFEILRLADAGDISLDEPLEKYLPTLQDKRWFKFRPATIRDLILRTKSFGGPMKPTGYDAGEPCPKLNQILQDGTADFPKGLAIRSNRNRKQKPQCANSILLQLILERHYDQPLSEIMEERVLGPLGMKHSFYATELTAEQEQEIALGHDPSGTTLPGGYRRYPELAAGGLWTTPADYARFVRHVIRAAKGEDNRFLKQATARAGLTAQTGYRSLLFHINKDGLIYWGGNTKGYFTAMQASIKDEYVMVAFCNSDLNWPLVMGSLYQSGGWIARQRQGESMVLFTQPGDEMLSMELEKKLKALARNSQVNFIELDASQGVPACITATPALLFQSPQGRTLFGGKVTEWAAVENFIRAARSRAVPPAAATIGPILVRRQGRQAIGFQLKWTDWQGKMLPSDWQAAFLPALENSLSASTEEAASFFPTDRRFYLDVHPYAQGDSIFLSLALFSQFDCIQPVFDNFGKPLTGVLAEKDALLIQAAEIFAQAVQERLADTPAGDALFPLPDNTPNADFEALELRIPSREETETQPMQAVPSACLSGHWRRPKALREGQPLLQFNFPSPLERYAGEVRQLNGNLDYDKGQLSGEFVATLNSLTMGMAELDAKVLKQYLKVRRYATAVFSFQEQAVDLQWGQNNTARISGNFHFLGEEIPLLVDAKLQPLSADGRIVVRVRFELDIARPFGLSGPDGPAAARERLQFSLQFQMEA